MTGKKSEEKLIQRELKISGLIAGHGKYSEKKTRDSNLGIVVLPFNVVSCSQIQSWSEAMSLNWKQGDADDTVSGVTWCHNHPGELKNCRKLNLSSQERKCQHSQSDNDWWNLKFFLLNWIGISSSIGRRLDRVHQVIIRYFVAFQFLSVDKSLPFWCQMPLGLCPPFRRIVRE